MNVEIVENWEKMESSPYDEEYKLEEDDEPSQVDLYTPSPRPPSQKKHNEVQPVTGPFLFQAKIKKNQFC